MQCSKICAVLFWYPVRDCVVLEKIKKTLMIEKIILTHWSNLICISRYIFFKCHLMGPMSSFFGFIKGFITNANVRGVKKGLIVSPSNYSKQVLSCMTVVLHTMYKE